MNEWEFSATISGVVMADTEAEALQAIRIEIMRLYWQVDVDSLDCLDCDETDDDDDEDE